MAPFIYARTSLLSSRAQFLRAVKNVAEVCHRNDHLLLFSVSSNAPELEQSIAKLNSVCNESIGCLSNVLPIQRSFPFFTLSTALLNKHTCQAFSILEAGESPVQIGRWHSYKSRDVGSIDQAIDINWADIWNRTGSNKFLPDEIREMRYDAPVCLTA